ncbi:hypothetical protein [Streptomyces umbrinus]
MTRRLHIDLSRVSSAY